ncbi:MAG: T9SS C-terminal target domain-containing protein [Bacteroidetes bacterium]|nr:MAG: T9SS C-terminal target domain-containing protein [Bacteroidota bacterium]
MISNPFNRVKLPAGILPFMLLLVLLLSEIRTTQSENHLLSAPHSQAVAIMVVDLSGYPIENAVVIFNDNPALMGVTDDKGRAEFSLPAGNYQMVSYRHNYLDYHTELTLGNQDTSYTISKAPSVNWTTSPSDAPVGVGEKNGMRLAAAGDKVYLWAAYGGEPGTTNYSSLTDFYEYDIPTDSWSKLPDAPFGSDYGLSTAYGKTPQGKDAIYIIKGRWTGQRTWLARYSIENNLWENDLAHQIPWREDLGNQYYGDNFQNYPRNGAVMVYTDEDFMYLFPGSGYGYEKYDWYRYSITANSWEDMGALPHRQGPGNAAVWVRGEEAGTDQDYLYVQFGITPSGNYTHAEFWRYGLQTQQWENMADHQFGADDGSALVWDGHEYIYHSPGAYQEQSWDTGHSQKRELMRYHILTNTWESMERAPYNRWGGWDDGGGMAFAGNAIYVMKGGDDIAWAEGEAPASGGDIPNNMLWKYMTGDNNYQLSVQPSAGSGSINLDQGSLLYPDGEQIHLSAIPEQGWDFSKWLVNGEYFCDNSTNTLVMHENKILQAVFTEQHTNVETPPRLNIAAYTHNQTFHFQSGEPKARLEMFDVMGRSVWQKQNIPAGNHTFEPGLMQGIYIVRITSPNGEKNKKLRLEEK